MPTLQRLTAAAFILLIGVLGGSPAKALDVTVPLGGNIQTAINNVNAAGGGSVILQAGIYTNTAPLSIKSFVTLIGQGPASTTITNKNSSNVITQASEGLANVTIANLRVTGRQTNTCYGILIESLATYHTNITITNVEVAYAGMGVHLKRVRGVNVANCNFHHNGTTLPADQGFFHNLYIRQCDDTNYSVTVTNCQLNNSPSGNGLNLSYNVNILVANSTATNNFFRGMRAADSVGFTVRNCTMSGNGDVGLLANVEINPTKNIDWSDNTAENNLNGGFSTASGVTGSAFYNNACGNMPANYNFNSSIARGGNQTCGVAPGDTWNGGSSTSGNWSDSANWSGSTVVNADYLFFGGSTRLNNTNDLSGFTFSGLTFNSGAGLFDLRGNSFALTGGITNNSASAQTINNDINLSAGTHVIFAPASTANITNNGNIGEDGSGAASLTFSTPGSKTLVLNGSNSFSGGFTLTGTGTTQFGLVLGNTNALGTNWINVNNGSLNLSAVAPGADPFVIANPVFTNSRDAFLSGSNIVFTGLYVEGGQKQISVASGQTVTLNGGLQNLAGCFAIKTGSGTLVLNGALTGGQGTAAENGSNYVTAFKVGTGTGTLLLGNSSALGTGAGYFVVNGGGGGIMASTDLSGANALPANVVWSAANGGTGATIGGTNNITFGGNLIVGIGNAGAVTRHLIVTNTAATVFAGTNVLLSDGASPGTLLINVAGTSGGVTISGAIADGNQPGGKLVKVSAGTLLLSGTNTYTGATAVSNGTLVVNGTLATGAVNVPGGTLSGIGTLKGPTTINGGTLSPAGDGAIGTLTISNVLDLQGTLAVDINKTTGTNDLITGLTSVTYGGTLALNNLSGTLTTSDSFKLFSAGSYSGVFTNITPSTPAGGLVWNTNTLTTDGTLRIASVAGPLTYLEFLATPVISGASLTISATNTGAGTVYLLTSTNVAAPINTWTAIWSNLLGGSGSFTTNLPGAVNPLLNQQFYRLSNTNN